MSVNERVYTLYSLRENANQLLNFISIWNFENVRFFILFQVVSAHELYHRERVPKLDFSEVAEVGFKTGPKRTRFLAPIAK